MGRERVDITGKIFGRVKALEWHSYEKGKGTRWLCECLNCGNVYDTSLSALRKNPKSCLKCKMEKRTFPTHVVSCLSCGKDVVAPTNHKTRTCSKKCANKLSAERMRASRQTTLEDTVKYLVIQTRSRAKRRGLEHNLTEEWAAETLRKQKNKCARTGVELKPSRPDTGGLRRTHKHTASLDRVDSNKGYTTDNVEIVTYFYNSAKNKFTGEELEEMCKQVLEKAGYSVTCKEGRSP